MCSAASAQRELTIFTTRTYPGILPEECNCHQRRRAWDDRHHIGRHLRPPGAPFVPPPRSSGAGRGRRPRGSKSRNGGGRARLAAAAGACLAEVLCNAWCNRCVAVCARSDSSAAVGVDSARTGAVIATLPDLIVPYGRNRSFFFLVSVTLQTKPSPRIVPESRTWPPPRG